MWKQFPRDLCSAMGCSGVLYDRIGYGLSSPLREPRSVDYLHRAAYEELPQIIDLVLPDREYVVVGHSDGGSIALLHAAQNPRRLRAVVTAAAHVSVEPQAIAGIEIAQAAFEAGRLEGLRKYHGDKTDTVFKAWSDTWLSDAFASWNIEEQLPKITAPVFAVQGEHDQYGTENQLDLIVRQCAGRAEKHVLEDCAHSPHLEVPDTFIGSVKTFIDSLN